MTDADATIAEFDVVCSERHETIAAAFWRDFTKNISMLRGTEGLQYPETAID